MDRERGWLVFNCTFSTDRLYPAIGVFSLQCFDTVGWDDRKGIWENWFVGGDDLTGALQLSPSLPSSFASINTS